MLKLRTEAAVGIVVVAGFILLCFIVFGISGIYALRPGYMLKARFNYVGAIDQGAPVRFAGVKIGEVKQVEIIEPGGAPTGHVEITFFIVENVKIHEHDSVVVAGTHIMSEPHIAIDPAKGDMGRVLKDGDVIQGKDPISMDELIKQGKDIMTKLNQFLDEVEESFRTSGAQESMKKSLVNLSELLASLNKMTSGREEEISQGLSSLSKSANELSLLLESANRGEGTLGKLIKEEELYNDLREFVKEIKQHPWRLLKKS